MRLQGKVEIENQRKRIQKTRHLQDLCGSPDYRNGFLYNMDKLKCEN